MKYSHLGVLDCFLSDLPQLEKLEFIAGSDEILNDPVRHKAAMEHHRNTVVKDAFRKVLTKEKIKKIITYHTNLNIKTGFSAELTYVDLIAYLNNLSICEFSFTKNQVGIFKLPKSAQSDTI